MNYPTEVTISLKTNFAFNLTHTGCLKTPVRDMCDFATIGSSWFDQNKNCHLSLIGAISDFVFRSMVTFVGLKIS